MTRPQLLGVLLKVLGIFLAVNGLDSLPGGMYLFEHFENEQELFRIASNSVWPPLGLMIGGVLLFLKSNWLVRVAYGQNTIGELAEGDHAEERELLGCVLKGLGYWYIFGGVIALPKELSLFFLARSIGTIGISSLGITIVAGCFLVFGTDWFENLAYGKAASGEVDEIQEVPPS